MTGKAQNKEILGEPTSLCCCQGEPCWVRSQRQWPYSVDGSQDQQGGRASTCIDHTGGPSSSVCHRADRSIVRNISRAAVHTNLTRLNTKVLRIGPKSITSSWFYSLCKGQSFLHCTRQVSGCPLNAPVQDLVLPLAYCRHLASIIAVNCGLYGGLPSLDPLPPSRFNGIMYTSGRSKLASSLEVLELSGNNLSHMDAIPPSTRKLVVSSNKQPLRLADGALTSALQHQVAIDLRGTTLHQNTHREAQRLLGNGALRRTAVNNPRVGCIIKNMSLMQYLPYHAWEIVCNILWGVRGPVR